MQPLYSEITTETPLCDRQGLLNPEALGWSRRPLHRCNLSGHFPRKKKWDYWCVTGDQFLFSATIAHIDYLSLGALYLLEYDTGRFAEQTAVKLLSRHPHMPETVGGTVTFHHGKTHLVFEQGENTLNMSVQSDRFGGTPLEASITVKRPPEQESLNVVVPWDRKHFQFTSKQQCLPATGNITWGGEHFVFAPDSSFACLDFGRGIWPYRSVWNWGAFSGYCDNDLVGINLGAKWTDGTGMNENGILLNGRLYKILDDIIFDYDADNFLRPWHITSASSDTVNLAFTPFHERAEAANLLLVKTTTHQMFGHFSGTLQVDGRTIRIDNILGWAEEHQARW